jgi:hypothetical protein
MLILLLQAIQTLLIILIVLNILFYLMAHGSGHQIPSTTDLTIGAVIAGLIVSYISLKFMIKQLTSKQANK